MDGLADVVLAQHLEGATALPALCLCHWVPAGRRTSPPVASVTPSLAAFPCPLQPAPLPPPPPTPTHPPPPTLLATGGLASQALARPLYCSMLMSASGSASPSSSPPQGPSPA
jgi:hypothetical protein